VNTFTPLGSHINIIIPIYKKVKTMTNHIESREFGEYNKNHVYYHFGISTKYRFKTINDTRKKRLNEVISEIAIENRWEICALNIASDHVHLLFSASPDIAPSMYTGDKKSIYESIEPHSEIFKILKGRSSKELGTDFKWGRGGYIGTICQEENPEYKDIPYKYNSAAHKAHILFFSYKCNRTKLEELIGFENLLNFKSELNSIIENKFVEYKEDSSKKNVFKLLDFNPKNDDNVKFLIRQIQTFQPTWVLKSLLNKFIDKPTDEQINEWMNSWYISSQGPKFDTVQGYIDFHDFHVQKWESNSEYKQKSY
jgi:putative transposase